MQIVLQRYLYLHRRRSLNLFVQISIGAKLFIFLVLLTALKTDRILELPREYYVNINSWILLLNLVLRIYAANGFKTQRQPLKNMIIKRRLKGSVSEKSKAKNNRFWSLLIFILSVASIRRKLFKTTHTEERSVHTNSESCNIHDLDHKKITISNKSFGYYNL